MGGFKIINVIVSVIISLYSATPLSAQKQGNQWCFGDSAGVDWTDPQNPQFFVSSSEYRGSCASISDNVGNLLFYCANRISDGSICSTTKMNHIYNRYHEVMEDGACLPGNGWFNEHTIIPAPSSDSLFYVFSVDMRFSLSYNVIDISVNQGLGKVIERDHQLVAFAEGSHFVTSITTVKHGNGRDWWVIAKSGGGAVYNGDLPLQYYIFLVTPSGVFTTYRAAEGSYISNIVQLLFNHQGKILFDRF